MGFTSKRETLLNEDVVLPVKRVEPHPLDDLYQVEEP